MERPGRRETQEPSEMTLEEKLLKSFEYDNCCPLVKYIIESASNLETRKAELEERLAKKKKEHNEGVESVNILAALFYKYNACILGIDGSTEAEEKNLIEEDGVNTKEALTLIRQLHKDMEREYNHSKKALADQIKQNDGWVRDFEKDKRKLIENEAAWLEEIRLLKSHLAAAKGNIDMLESRVSRLSREFGDKPSIQIVKHFIELIAERVRNPPTGWEIRIGYPDAEEANAGALGLNGLVAAGSRFLDILEDELRKEPPFAEYYRDAELKAANSIDANRGELGTQIPSHFLQSVKKLGKKHEEGTVGSIAYLDAGRLVARGVESLFDGPSRKILKKMSTSRRGM